MSITEEELDARLSRARAAVAPISSAATESVARDARAHVGARRWRVRAGVAATSATLLIGGIAAGPAAAEAVRQFLAESGWAPEAGGEILEDSPFIDTSASDLGAYLQTIYPEWLPLAPGQSRESLIEEVRSSAAENPGLQQAIGLQRAFESRVYVAWIDEWNSAHAADDDSRADAALVHLTAAATWPAFVATDGGGVTAIMAGFAERIAAGDAEAAQALAQYEWAPSWDGVNRDELIREVFAEYALGAL